MRIIGIDLSGPSNPIDTVLSVFEKQDGELKFIKLLNGASDSEILKEISLQSIIAETVIGIDAPLSYQDGGGDRPGDKQLRKYIVSLGMKSGSIMSPTFNRMVYLTLRGIRLSREVGNLKSPYPISIVEVHPGAVIGSRIPQSDLEHVLNYKQNLESREFIKKWLAEQNLTGLPDCVQEQSHSIDSCAAALGAWHWKDERFQPKWLLPADPPLHPYDYCC
jgi:predicted nuclease with RNAse H fold